MRHTNEINNDELFLYCIYLDSAYSAIAEQERLIARKGVASAL